MTKQPHQPQVSVLVPAYNDAAYLVDSLGSLKAQTMDDFEVIVCDDGSSDDSCRLARQIAADDPRFRIVNHDQNLGMTRNWNRALSYASGRYVTKLDADDALQSEMLEQLCDALAAGAKIAFCCTTECDEQLRSQAPYRGEAGMLRAGLPPDQAHQYRGHHWYPHCFDDFQLWHSNAFMLARTTLLDIGGWDTRFGCAADTDLILRLLELDLMVAHQPYVGVLYRLRGGSVSDRFRREGRLLSESVYLHLASLKRWRQAGHRLAPRLRWHWWRYWHMRRHLAAADRPPQHLRPPATVLWPQQLRHLAHQLLRGQPS